MTEREASIGLKEIARAIVEAAAKHQRCLHKWSDMGQSNRQQVCKHCNKIRLIK